MNSKLNEFREKKGLTQKDIADILDISKNYYVKIEHGDRNTSYNFIKKFKKAFPEADIEKLFFQDNGKKIS